MREQLQHKVDSSIKLLRTIAKAHEGQEIELAYSGGKDSDVILQLAKEAGILFRAIYKNTTIDPSGTISHCEAMGVEIVQPKVSFFKLIEKKGMPTRFHRFCCSELKEYKILDTVILGIRREERRVERERIDTPNQHNAVCTVRKTMSRRYSLSSIGLRKMYWNLFLTEI